VLRAATPERLSALSDAVLAVLITVLVLDLRPPELPTYKALSYVFMQLSGPSG
jgi:TMEM175 potassium channel family protein